MSDNRTGLALFPNKGKSKDSHPDFRGELYVTKEDLKAWAALAGDGGAVKLRIACWKKVSKAGANFLSGSVSIDNGPPQAQAQQPTRQGQQRGRSNSFDEI